MKQITRFDTPRFAFTCAKSCAALCLLPALVCGMLTAQQVSSQVPEHAPDGGARLRIQSIDIPPIANAPFSAVVVTELTTIMPDGSKRSIWNHRLVARDSAGRVFQERRNFSPTGQNETTPLFEQDYLDPNQHRLYVCFPNRTCNLSSYEQPTAPSATTASLPPSTTRPDGATITREDLGRNTIEGVDAVGSREVTVLPGALIGSEKPQPMVKEFWFAPRLRINLVTKRFDPRVSTSQNFNVTQINLSEPDPRLFVPPADYRVINLDQP